MGAEAYTEVDDDAEEAARSWGPQPGPQELFAASVADIAIFGGAAGGGKSFALLLEAARHVLNPRVRKYRAVLFRRTNPEIVGSGGLWDESQELYRVFGGRPRGAPALDWTFEAVTQRIQHRHRIEFRHLQHETNVQEHQGRQYAFIGFDEVTHFTERQFWYMVSRLRSMCGVKPYLRATCNPDPDSFVAKLVAWWIGPDGYPIPERSGVLRWFVRVDDTLHWYDSLAAAQADQPDGLPMSFTFIAAKLSDNRILMAADPTYRARLMSMGRVDRMRLLGDLKDDKGGNWRVRDGAGLFFRQADFRLCSGPPSKILRTVRFWDKGASSPTPKHPDPDWTRGARVSLCAGGELYCDDMRSAQARPTDVLKLIASTALADGVGVEVGLWQDTGGAGKTDAELTADALTGFVVQLIDSFGADTTGVSPTSAGTSSRAKRVFAKVWAPLVERGRFYVKQGSTAEDLIPEADAFPDGAHDDAVDSVSGAAQVLVGQGLGFWEGLVEAAAKMKGAT